MTMMVQLLKRCADRTWNFSVDFLAREKVICLILNRRWIFKLNLFVSSLLFLHLAIENICGHLITLLSQTNWRIRAAFFDSLVTVAAYIGIESEVFIEPLLKDVREE